MSDMPVFAVTKNGSIQYDTATGLLEIYNFKDDAPKGSEAVEVVHHGVLAKLESRVKELESEREWTEVESGGMPDEEGGMIDKHKLYDDVVEIVAGHIDAVENPSEYGNAAQANAVMENWQRRLAGDALFNARVKQCATMIMGRVSMHENSETSQNLPAPTRA